MKTVQTYCFVSHIDLTNDAFETAKYYFEVEDIIYTSVNTNACHKAYV